MVVNVSFYLGFVPNKSLRAHFPVQTVLFKWESDVFSPRLIFHSQICIKPKGGTIGLEFTFLL